MCSSAWLETRLEPEEPFQDGHLGANDTSSHRGAFTTEIIALVHPIKISAANDEQKCENAALLLEGLSAKWPPRRRQHVTQEQK